MKLGDLKAKIMKKLIAEISIGYRYVTKFPENLSYGFLMLMYLSILAKRVRKTVSASKDSRMKLEE